MGLGKRVTFLSLGRKESHIEEISIQSYGYFLQQVFTGSLKS